MRKYWLLAAGSVHAMTAQPAMAQDDVAGDTEARTASGDDTGAILVTAQRRTALNKDVPIAITVISPKTLEASGIRDTRDLVTAVPGLRMNQAGAVINPTLRGVTTNLGFLSEPNIATYIDNVYQATNFIGAADLPDVQSIQVLKGPQGTLFGRNATGGAILVTTRDPEFTASGDTSLSYGNYDEVRATAFLTAPIVGDTLAASVSGAYARRDPYTRNIFRPGTEKGLENVLVRGKIRFAPSDTADLILTGLYSKNKNGDGQSYANLNGNNAYKSQLPPGTPVAVDPYTYASEQDLFFNSTMKSANLRGTIEAGPGEIKSTTAYTRADSTSNYDSDNTPGAFLPIPIFGKSRTFTQELLYTLTDVARVEGTLGAFYFNSTTGYEPIVYGPIVSIRTRDRAKSIGLFGEFSYDLTDSLQLTAGLRYSWERKASTVGFGPPPDLPPDSSVFSLGSRSWTSVTPRASILYRLSPTTNLFLTYSEGFKSGLYNTVEAQTTPVDPEKLRSIEGGAKLARVGLDLSLTGFYYDYSNIQISSFDGLVQQVQNAASARIYGLDMAANWRPTSALSIAAGANYLHARYRKFQNAAVFSPVPVSGSASCDWRGATPANTGNVSLLCDVSGNYLAYAPDLSGSLVATYVAPTSGGDITLSASGYYSSEFYLEPLERLKQAAYATLGARLGFGPDAVPGLQVAAYGRNITSAKVYETVFVQSSDSYRLQIPATYGVEVKYSF